MAKKTRKTNVSSNVSANAVPEPSKQDIEMFAGAPPLWEQKFTPCERGSSLWVIALSIIATIIKDRASLAVLDPFRSIPYKGKAIDVLNIVPLAEKHGLAKQEERRGLRDAILTVCNSLKEGVRSQLPFAAVEYRESRKWRFKDGSPTPLLTDFVERWNSNNGDAKAVAATYGVDEFGNPSLEVGSIQSPLKAAIACKMAITIPPKRVGKGSAAVDPSIISDLESELIA